MSFLPKNLPPIQDMPPPGGFPKINLDRRVVSRGPPGWTMWVGLFLGCSYGYYKVGKANRKKAAYKIAERRHRFQMAPFLQAEADLQFLAKERAMLEMEQRIVNDVDKNHAAGALTRLNYREGGRYYNKKLWTPPHISDMDVNLVPK